MEGVDQLHQPRRIAEAACRGKIARHLIAPGEIERMLHHRQQLHMGIPHLLDIGGHFIRHALIGVEPALFVQLPRPQMHFIDADRALIGIVRRARRHPLFVLPAVFFEVKGLAGGLGPRFGMKRVRICLHLPPRRAADGVFIGGVLLDARYAHRPDAVVVLHGIFQVIPIVEIPHDADRPRVRRPYGKVVSTLAGVRAHELMGIRAVSLPEQIALHFVHRSTLPAMTMPDGM